MSHNKRYLEELAKRFPGEKDLAERVLDRLSDYGRGLDEIAKEVRDTLPRSEGRSYFIRGIASIHAEVYSEIISPIIAKFPELKNKALGIHE